jgi:hypothetical protein
MALRNRPPETKVIVEKVTPKGGDTRARRTREVPNKDPPALEKRREVEKTASTGIPVTKVIEKEVIKTVYVEKPKIELPPTSPVKVTSPTRTKKSSKAPKITPSPKTSGEDKARKEEEEALKKMQVKLQ